MVDIRTAPTLVNHNQRARFKDFLAKVLQQHPKILVSDLADILEEEIEMRVQDYIAELRDELEGK